MIQLSNYAVAIETDNKRHNKTVDTGSKLCDLH